MASKVDREERGLARGSGRWIWSSESAVIAAALVIGAGLSFSSALLNDGDTSWHLATGQWILAHRAIPHVDPFSFTFRGGPWTTHEWLPDVIMALCYRLGGWQALMLPFALAAAALALIVGRDLTRRMPVRYVLLALAALVLVLAPFALARPHVLTWPIVAVWLLLLMRAREQHRAPPLAAALVIALWANVHASFLFGLVIAAFFGLEALIEEGPDRLRALREWLIFGLACLAAAFLTPHGLQAFLYPLQVSGMKALPLIQEWRATDPVQDWPFVLFCVAAAAAAALRWRTIGLFRLALLGLLGVMAFLHARHQPLFAIVAVLLLPPRPRRRSDRSGWSSALIFAGLAALVLARLAIPFDRGDSATFPKSAIAALPPALHSQPVFNEYSFGGPLILAGIAPYIDGRSDMYGDALTIDQNRIVMGDRARFDRAVARWKIKWTILSPSAPLVRLLDRDSRWRTLYRDRFAVVHVRRPS